MIKLPGAATLDIGDKDLYLQSGVVELSNGSSIRVGNNSRATLVGIRFVGPGTGLLANNSERVTATGCQFASVAFGIENGRGSAIYVASTSTFARRNTTWLLVDVRQRIERLRPLPNRVHIGRYRFRSENSVRAP